MRIGIDVGGTFIDVVLVDKQGRLTILRDLVKNWRKRC